jgi:hypothetical protein
MTLRIASPCTLGIAAALTFGLAAAAAAQTTTPPRSDVPAKVVKEAPGEVAPAKVDTVTVYHTDTTRIYSTDTVRMNVPGPTTTVTVNHVDTVTLQPLALRPRMADGFYVGLASGPSIPANSLHRSNGTGALGQVNVGWQGLKNALGVRFDETYVSYAVQDAYDELPSHPVVWNSNLALKLQVPYLTHMFGYAPRFTVYALGGGSYVRYDDLRVSMDAGQPGVGSDNVGLADGSWRGAWGYNFGAGMSWHWSSNELFAEVRSINFNPSVSPMAREVPFSIGLNIF